ncbi:MAG: hypothetical protein IJY50_09910 [Clostridia bacterium]|nr:hypothetical protein [Clostridia bacterium]
MKTICFLGDSITRRGYWIAEIFSHLKTQGIRVYNCGVSGDSATRAIPRLYSDCLQRTPDTVVMMFGMNDVGRDLYDEGKNDVEQKKADRLVKYEKSLRTLKAMLDKAGCKTILCTPTPCDDVTPNPTVVNDCNIGLAKCADIVRGLAKEWNVPCVDFFTYLSPLVGTEYQTLPDRVHPTPESHHPMAQFFMKEMGWIEEMDSAPFLPLDELSQARFQVEQNAREIQFIEWNQMFTDRTTRKMAHADFLALAAERLASARAAGDERQIGWYSNYLNIVENRTEYESELVRLTLEMSAL